MKKEISNYEDQVKQGRDEEEARRRAEWRDGGGLGMKGEQEVEERRGIKCKDTDKEWGIKRRIADWWMRVLGDG